MARREDRTLNFLGQYRVRVRRSRALGRIRSEHGANLVEFALSVTILLTVIFGVMIMCTALYSYHFIAEAAREGSRYAMVRGSGCSTYGKFTTNCPVSSTEVQTYVRSLGYPGINPSNMTVTTTWPTTGSACTPTVTPCNNPGNLVQVAVSYQFPLSIPFVSASTLTMASTSQMVIAD